MADLNNWAISGRLTKDATFNTLASGKSVLTVNIAVNSGYGEYKKTLFVKVQQWGERGANIAQYLKKGTAITCAGRLSLNEWESKQDGTKHTDLQLDVPEIQFQSSTKDKDNNDNSDDVVY